MVEEREEEEGEEEKGIKLMIMRTQKEFLAH